MSSRFKPIDAPDAEPEKRKSKGTPYSATVIRAGDAAKMQFRPFSSQVEKPAKAPEKKTPSETPHESHGKPTVTLERKGKRVVGIKVHCGCGEVIELQCHYPSKDAPEADLPAPTE